MVYGLMGGYLVLFPRGRLRFGYMIFAVGHASAGTFSVYAWIVAALYLGIDLVSLFTGLQPHISHTAHLAGFFVGVVGTLCMKRLNFIASDAGTEFSIFTKMALKSKGPTEKNRAWRQRIESARKDD